MPRLAVLLSGGGSNFQALLDNKLEGEIVLCVSNRSDAYGLVRAQENKIDNYIIGNNQKLLKLLTDYEIDYVILAGYLKILPKEIIERFRNRILNIHPSLIPKYCGSGYYGERVHQVVLDHKENESGVTIHLVDEGVDTGRILAQERVKVLSDDTVETLSKRVLAIEHKLYYQTINNYIKSMEEAMKTALLSVYDKTGIVELAKELKALGWQLLSTGGTYKTLINSGLEVLEVSDVTDFPELYSGRVKTLHPKIFGGILYRRENEQDVIDSKQHDIFSIDLVVNTLYPFEETIRKENITLSEVIEQIDVGGPSMIRAAAKNFKDVTIITDPKDYDGLIKQLKESNETTLEQRQRYAMKAFSTTAYYDSLISQYFNELNNEQLPETLVLGYKKQADLRYGENPHQSAASYVKSELKSSYIMAAKQLHGKALSFNNIYDANGAVEIVKEFSEPTAVAIKHANPCGVGSAHTLLEAYQKAYECDTESIFGGIVALNRTVERDLAEKLNEIFLEIVIAPKFTDEALEVLTQKKNIRLLELDTLSEDFEPIAFKQVEGGLLVQESDTKLLEKFEMVTSKEPDDQTKKDLEFAWKVAKHISSNGVVLVKDNATIGLGLGFVNRYFATQEALLRAGDKAKGAVLGSDGFFPFSDSMQALGQAGVKAVIQPGGSIKDKEVIDEANNQDITMVMTGMRHFRH